MTDPAIRFDDGASYEEFMGRWSRLVGDAFLDWLAAPPGWRWIDVGCGNGAFTETIVQRCAPLEVLGVDPSEAQLAYAARHRAGPTVRFERGDAMALPTDDERFDAAVMALVIFFVPDPARSVAEMARVVQAGGSVSAYAWDFAGGGFPFSALHEEMAALGVPPLGPPSPDAARLDVLQTLWRDAGLVQLETCQLEVQRSFSDFDTFWEIARSGPRIAPKVGGLAGAGAAELKERVRARLRPEADGRIAVHARANAIKGNKPAR